MKQQVAEVASRSQPLTVITPTKRGMSWAAWGFLKLMSLTSLTRTRELHFIHFARWQRIRSKKLPRLGATQPKEDLGEDFFVFATNFNGRWDQYIDTFARVPRVRRGLWWLWRFCRGYPGPFPIRTFKDHINYHTYPELFYYDAYPEATVRDIKAALEVHKGFLDFRQKTREDETEEEFDDRYGRFIGAIADHLSSISLTHTPHLGRSGPPSHSWESS